MATASITLIGVNHFAPFAKKDGKIYLGEVEKTLEQLTAFLKKGERLGFDIPQFRIEMFELYEKAINGTLAKAFKLPESLPREERQNEKELVGLMARASREYGKEKAREVLARASPERMYYFELFLRARKLGYSVIGVLPKKADMIIERTKRITKNLKTIDLVEIAFKETKMAEYIKAMGDKKPKIIVTGMEHVVGRGLDLQLKLKGIQCRIIPIGKPVSRERLFRNSMARMHFDNRTLERFIKGIKHERKQNKKKPIRRQRPKK